MPLAIRNDQGCIDGQTNDGYVFGEIINPSSQSYDILDIVPTFFGPTGVIRSTSGFDMPGGYFVAPASSLPFAIMVQLEQPGFTRYELAMDAEPGAHTPRGDLAIRLMGTLPEDGDLVVDVEWNNPSPVSDYVAPFVVARDAGGRVSNFAAGFLGGSYTYTGTHTYRLTLLANVCWSTADVLAAGIIGE